MLKKLDIQNYAIIAGLTLEPEKGMVIITGETGAGKSILLGALGLALGDRADSSQVRDKSKKTIVEAIFEVDVSSKLSALLQEADVETDGELILRREIQSNGKSRAFINDTPVSLNQLQAVAAQLVDLHQQFDTLELGSRDFQRALLDAKSGAAADLLAYTEIYEKYSQLKKIIQEARAVSLKASQEFEYKSFLFQELDNLKWTPDEGKALADELNLLNHAEQVRSGIGKSVYTFLEGDQPVLPQLRAVINQLQPQAAYHPALPSLLSRLEVAYVELKDVSAELEGLLDSVQTDEQRLDELNARMALAQRIAKKHGLSDVDELVHITAVLSAELSKFQSAGDELEKLEKELSILEKNAVKLANQLHEKRKKEIPELEKSVVALLKRVGMPNARIQVALKSVPLYAGGTDEVNFGFDANLSGQFESLHKVASGGELSRLMLVLKSLVAHSLEMPTLIFDEIDSGISGEAARQVGMLMHELSGRHQVVAITHQPQIAALALQHLYIYKTMDDGQVTTHVRELTGDERIMTIARMMAGDHPSDAVITTAREMVNNGSATI
jgi:DNA repair protein RecN (Recombination protein N)